MQESQKPTQPGIRNLPAALTLFGLIVIAGPLLFGAVDRLVQLAIVTALALGMAIVPPAIPRPSKWFRIVIIALAATMVFKEFAPALLFGDSAWRETLAKNFGVTFSFFHHPEPARALDALLVVVVAVLWFLWCRTLTSDPAGANGVAWLLFASAGITATIWLLLGTSETNLIYGYRTTPGWTGFGPFPNRNHTANFLAMGAVIGCGCVVREGLKRRPIPVIIGLVTMAVITLGILESKSRGGILALAAGLGVFVAAGVLRAPGRKTIASGIATLLVAAALLMAFGGGVLTRFASGAKGDVSTDTRLAIWKDALGMWGDAPIFGHGIASFEGLFPVYQSVNLVAQYVIHPESSWLQWLVEIGLVLTLSGMIVLAVFCFEGLRRAVVHPRSFYLRLGGLAAVIVLMAHSIWDVPGHRWGTAGFALAALALACPIRRNAQPGHARRSIALLPLAIGAFWVCPFLYGKPLASPTALTRLMILNAGTQEVSLTELKQAVEYFPLDFRAHLALALRQLEIPTERHEAWKHLRTSLRLRPGSWALAVTAANASQRHSPGMALHFWSVAVERAGHRAGELLIHGTRATSSNPSADTFWALFVESHPELLLDYSMLLPGSDGRSFYTTWKAERIARKDLSPSEVTSFYQAFRRYGTVDHLKYWINEHPEREPDDFRIWATLLYSTGEAQDAWSLLARHIRDPQFTTATPTAPLVLLEAAWHKNPDDFVNTVAYAQLLQSKGKTAECARVIREASELPDAPPWITRKAAFLDAESGNFQNAVEKALHSLDKPANAEAR